MPVKKGAEIAPAKGKLGVLLVGLGAVSTTFIAGVEAIKQGLAEPIGSLTQMGTIRLGRRTDNRVPKVKQFVPLANLNDLVFGAWDIFPDSAFAAAMHAGVLEKDLLNKLKKPLQKIKPMKAVFDQSYVKRLSGVNVKQGKHKLDLANQLIEEIAEFKRKNKCDRLVMVWAASTEIFMKQHAVHRNLESFEKAMRENHKAIAPSMIYAYAALKSGVPFANGAPNLTVDIPALMDLANKNGVAVCGKDFKTGQTLMKTILAPGLKSRMLGLHGWYSTNILGNRDGEVLDDPSRSKRRRSRSFPSSNTFCNRKSILSSTRIFLTSSASTTTRRAVTTRKAGTTSISSAGSAIRCRSRSIFSAVTRFWRRRSCSTWRCSSTWPSARA
jgi:myo-inositol-1-phosphate synthase